jgi:hypothetical protein
MKQLLITGLAMALSGSVALAQYADDPYSNNGSNTAGNGSDRYRQEQYQSNYSEREQDDIYSDGYIDYDDDSYTTRLRRFNGAYLGYNYWSPMYSPYWAMPVYMDPWFYSPYRMGWSVRIGWGFGSPYWSSGWGMCNWWGYNGFSYWHYPYMGWGGYGYGYGQGYWNGFYEGGGRRVNYGPRASYNSMAGTGGRVASGVRANPNAVGGFRSDYQRRPGVGIDNRNLNGNRTTERNIDNRRTDNRVMDRDAQHIRIDNNTRRSRELNGGNRQIEQPQRTMPAREMRNNTERTTPVREIQTAPRQRESAPSRQYNSSPSRSNYNAPAPSRSSFGGSSPSRSGGSFGGGTRSSGGGRR